MATTYQIWKNDSSDTEPEQNLAYFSMLKLRFVILTSPVPDSIVYIMLILGLFGLMQNFIIIDNSYKLRHQTSRTQWMGYLSIRWNFTVFVINISKLFLRWKSFMYELKTNFKTQSMRGLIFAEIIVEHKMMTQAMRTASFYEFRYKSVQCSLK